VFHKLLLNFTWWVNRKDTDGHNVFQGGFLGLDNIGVFDRSAAAADRRPLEQATAPAGWRMYSLNMLKIALELARDDAGLRGHRHQVLRALLYIADADEHMGGRGSLWDEEDGFFYDVLHLPDGPLSRSRCARWSACCRCSPSRRSSRDARARLPGFAAG
jgi:hypothetical protein